MEGVLFIGLVIGLQVMTSKESGVRSDISCPEKLWMSHLWKCSMLVLVVHWKPALVEGAPGRDGGP